EITRDADVHASAKRHGESIAARYRRRESPDDRDRHPGREARMRHAKQSVPEDRTAAEVRRRRRTEQEVVQMLLRTYGKARNGNAGQLPRVAAEVGRHAEVPREIEGALAVPSVEVLAVAVGQRVSPEHCAAGWCVANFLGCSEQR